MTTADVTSLIREMFIMVAILGGPILLVGLIVGILVSILQAITQVHEATLAFIPKVIAISIVIVLLGPFLAENLTSYTQRLFDRMIAVGGS